MAITDDRGTISGPYERQPPQDHAAEQSVLGGMMLSKDAIADVVEVLHPGDFYRPAHQMVYDCVLDLYGRGEPADPVTVAAELERRGELGRVGGAVYLHTLIATVPTAANAGYYAEIVAEKAVLRRLVEAGTRIVQMGYNGAEGAEIDEVVDRAQSAIYEVTERRMSEDFVSLEELLQPTMDEIDAIASRGGSSLGVPTGFVDLDEVTNGLHPGQMIIVAARPGVGKALALDTPLPTPTGWTTMGALAVGDELLGADGQPTKIVNATDVLTNRPCYEVEFSDGTVITADAQHQWLTDTGIGTGRSGVIPAIRTTAEIAASLTANSGLSNAVTHAKPLALPRRDLPLSPYLLGVWLSRGQPSTTRFATDDPELICYIEEDGWLVIPEGDGSYRISPTVEATLRNLGVLDDKHIPVEYLRAAQAQRHALLAGLCDAGGIATVSGLIRFSTANSRLAMDVYDLIVGLGYQCLTVMSATELILNFHTDDPPFRLTRKRLAHKEYSVRADAPDDHRFIVDVRPVPSVPVRCVQVDAADRLYLAGRSMIPTHNSTLGLDFARSCSVKHGMSSVIFSLEMSRTEIVMRLLSAEARIRLADMRGGRMSDDDWTRLARRMSEISEAPLFVDDSPNMTMMEIRAKARRLKQRNDLKLIVVDYMQLMTSGKRVESRQQEVSEFSRNLKLLAKELEVPLVAISQLNRGPEQRTDKRPMLSDLRESGCMTRDTTLLRADTGAPVTFGTLLDEGHDGVLVWSLDEQRRLVAAPITNVFPSGVKETFRLTLASGRTVTASGNHRFLTFGGWVELEKLAEGDQLAVPRWIPAPIASGLGWSRARIELLAHLIGDSQDEENLTFVEQAAAAEFGIENLRSNEKRIPDVLYQANDDEIKLFLRHLWAADGSERVPTEHSSGETQPRVYYSTSSRELADGVAMLLARLHIPTRIDQISYPKSAKPDRHVTVTGPVAIRRFRTDIGGYGQHGNYVDASPIDSSDPSETASDDVHWDKIVTIEPLGPQPVYDATVKGTHNFIANGIVAHNSLEQDADMVLLIHRPDAWERDDPRAGEADLILAKHRAGPTSTITVAHQLHYSRFSDLAQG